MEVVGARAVCQWGLLGDRREKCREHSQLHMDPQSTRDITTGTIPVLGDAKTEPPRVDRSFEEGRHRVSRTAARLGESPPFGSAPNGRPSSAGRYETPTLYDEVGKEDVLTQPAAIKAVCDWADLHRSVKLFGATRAMCRPTASRSSRTRGRR